MDFARSKIASQYFTAPKIISSAIITSALILVLSLGLALATFLQLPDEIPLFYSTKTQILVNKNFIFLVPAIIFANLIINLTLAKILLPKWPFLSQILATAQALVAFLIFWAQIEIILLFL